MKSSPSKSKGRPRGRPLTKSALSTESACLTGRAAFLERRRNSGQAVSGWWLVDAVPPSRDGGPYKLINLGLRPARRAGEELAIEHTISFDGQRSTLLGYPFLFALLLLLLLLLQHYYYFEFPDL